jgi:hypothetical protein
VVESTTVFRIEFDANTFRSLRYDGDITNVILDLVRLDGERRGQHWVSRPVTMERSTGERPTIWRLGVEGSFLVDTDTAAALESHLSAAGELLPLTWKANGESLLLLNVTRVVDCLEAKASVLGPIQWLLEFRADRLPDGGLFKIPDSPVVHLFCVERPGQADSFRNRVERLGFKGLDFAVVWSGAEGAVPFSLFRI